MMSEYTACLLGWFYGIEPQDVLKHEREYTQAQIDEAQAYCTKKMADPIAYWYGDKED